ncbi:hypothetical protein JKP88DRAFT_351617 [Tribonema minus]|uniref:Uncharacterized protein n=1 Tax=Tribonema minus TaxID=303371 RepID=A0A835YIQ1_9STRA|nr:hypothetical protein JKP88DRAFT_351617 [Tribonema minus]
MRGWLDVRRMVDVGLLTMAIDGVITPRWYAILERTSTSKALPVVVAKTVASSLIYGPFANGVFLAGVPVLRYGRAVLGRGFDWVAWRRQLLIATIRDLQLVTPCEFFNQLLVPFKYQPLGYQFSEIGFHIVLSLIAHNEMELPMKWFFRGLDNVAGTNTLTRLQQMMYAVAADEGAAAGAIDAVAAAAAAAVAAPHLGAQP